MRKTAGRHNDDVSEKPVIILEFIAAATVFSVVAVVLFMIFTYRPV